MTINRIDIKEFREAGYLQEVNRLFFHPLGLALEVQQNDDDSWQLGGVWDYRDDPEGIIFAIENNDQLAKFKENAERIRHEREDRASVRMRMFHSGSPVQPLKQYVPRQDESTDDFER